MQIRRRRVTWLNACIERALQLVVIKMQFLLQRASVKALINFLVIQFHVMPTLFSKIFVKKSIYKWIITLNVNLVKVITTLYSSR